MFQNSYQNGSYFDLFDPKAPQDKVKNLFRMVNVHGNNKIFDKLLKTFVYEFSTSTSKLCFPKEDKKDLYLIQQYLILQIYFFPQMSWNIELVVSDHTKTKRRIILSSATHKVQIKPFFIKHPCNLKEGIWHNFGIDLFSFIEAFKGQEYRSLDCIYITGHFKLRRIYTTPTKPTDNECVEETSKDISFLPKNFYFPVQVPFDTSVVCFGDEIVNENMFEATEPSTKNNSHLIKKHEGRVVSSPKAELMKSTKNVIKQKNFLANTNGSQMIRKMQNQRSSSDQSPTEKILKNPQSTDKILKKNNKLIKTQVPPKVRPSIDRKSQAKKEEKTRVKAKLNPWRTNPKDAVTDGSQLAISKHDSRNLDSAQTTLFKTKNNLTSKFNESKNKGFGRSDYSDSEYVELSQKFSTMTDGKFLLKHQVNNELNKDQNDEIQQNIEMETNSIYSKSHKKQQESPDRMNEIVESICDSLQKSRNLQNNKHQMFRNSHYGFGENLMRDYMGAIQRPYSPPLGQRQLTEEELTNNNRQKEQLDRQQLQLIYDPTLNCYYDHKTHTYYQLKN